MLNLDKMQEVEVASRNQLKLGKASIICTLENVHKIEILAYHDMAKSKYESLKIKYPLSDIRVATKEDVKRAEQIISNRIKSNFAL